MTSLLENTADIPAGRATLPEPGDETKGLSQGRIVAKRFFGHSAAVVSMVVFFLILVLAISSIGLGPIPGWWKYSYTDTPTLVNDGHPTWQFLFQFGEHPFGQDRVGRDLFAMTMRGAQISMFIMITVGVLAAIVGVLIGASAGFFRGKTEGVLMRFTDMIIIIPPLIAAAVVSNAAHGVLPMAVFLGLVSWTGMARLVRGDFLTLREREFVDAARLAGASSRRIIFKHILPNAVGVITVNATLLMSAAILTETALSYVGLGVKAPDVSLGSLISANEAAFSTRPWLFWWPGLFIVIISLSINFIGDGLRDAFDPRQKKLRMRRVKETGTREELLARAGADLPGVSTAGPAVAPSAYPATTVAGDGLLDDFDPRNRADQDDDGRDR